MDTSNSVYGLIMMLLWALFAVAIIFVIVRLVRGSRSDVSVSLKPLDVAKTRYAKGEIDKKEFEQIKKDLAE